MAIPDDQPTQRREFLGQIAASAIVLAGAASLNQATRYIWGMRTAAAAGDDDVQAVVVMRHGAIPMALNDAIWAKYQLGKELKIRDYPSEKWATRNPWITAAEDNKAASNRPQSSLAWLASHGHVLLGCNGAMLGQASLIGQRTKANPDVVYEELKANLVTGVILQPNGVYAVHRAQEAGCTYIRVS